MLACDVRRFKCIWCFGRNNFTIFMSFVWWANWMGQMPWIVSLGQSYGLLAGVSIDRNMRAKSMLCWSTATHSGVKIPIELKPSNVVARNIVSHVLRSFEYVANANAFWPWNCTFQKRKQILIVIVIISLCADRAKKSFRFCFILFHPTTVAGRIDADDVQIFTENIDAPVFSTAFQQMRNNAIVSSIACQQQRRIWIFVNALQCKRILVEYKV